MAVSLVPPAGAALAADGTLTLSVASDADAWHATNVSGRVFGAQQVDDEVLTGLTWCTLALRSTSSDATYAGLTSVGAAAGSPLRGYRALLIDNDQQGIVQVSPPEEDLSEPASETSMYVMLNKVTEGPVDVAVTSGNTAKCTVVNATLTLLPADVYVPVAVGLRAVDNWIDDGTVSYTITVTADYALADVHVSYAVAARTLNDDVAGLAVERTALVVNETGTTDATCVRLTSEPVASVSVRVRSSNATVFTVQQAGAAVSVSELAFGASSWNTCVPFTVRGQRDALRGDQVASVLLTTSTGDAKYAAVSRSDVRVTNLDVYWPTFTRMLPTLLSQVGRNASLVCGTCACVRAGVRACWRACVRVRASVGTFP